MLSIRCASASIVLVKNGKKKARRDIIRSMTENMFAGTVLFEVETPLGFRVRVTRAYWELITAIKHPVMAGQEAAVQEVLEQPDEIRQSRSDPAVHLFYRARGQRWFCAVARRLNGDGFLITTYPTDSIKEGTRIWPK
jgi:hypothetical protein